MPMARSKPPTTPPAGPNWSGKFPPQPNRERGHPQLNVTLPPWAHEEVERMMRVWGMTKSAVILRLISLGMKELG
jgi:hypothetical protein